jgi:hypothetical protein
MPRTLLLLVLAVAARPAAAEEPSPSIVLGEDGEVDGDGLPAIAADGQTVAAIDQWGGYDGSSHSSLVFFSVATGKRLRTIRLEWTRSEQEDPIGQQERSRRARVARESTALLRRGKYRPLVELTRSPDPPEASHSDWHGTGGGVTTSYERDVLRARRGTVTVHVKLRHRTSHPYCCGELSDKTPCHPPAEISHVWADARGGAVLVRYDYVMHGPDGCESPGGFVVRSFGAARSGAALRPAE